MLVQTCPRFVTHISEYIADAVAHVGQDEVYRRISSLWVWQRRPEETLSRHCRKRRPYISTSPPSADKPTVVAPRSQHGTARAYRELLESFGDKRRLSLRAHLSSVRGDVQGKHVELWLGDRHRLKSAVKRCTSPKPGQQSNSTPD
ncbi:hypothetical protein LSAT2_023903 [Lamellibrachia satsuma]|nr:hypothetical protein LSAT2_023903 [Lamellibrachia satsuma]